MNVFVTGATGYIGSSVCAALQAAHHTVLGLARSDASEATLRARGITPYRGDIRHGESLVEAVQRTDAVIHAAYTNNDDAALADAEAVTAMLDAQRGTSKTFIYTSSVWVYGSRGDEKITSTTEIAPIPFAQWETVLEEHVLIAALDGIRSIVIRPSVVYGYGGGLPEMFIESAREMGAARYVGPGTNRWPLVHVDTLGVLYANALKYAPPSTTWVAAQGPSYRVLELAEAASIGAGTEGRTVSWDVEEARRELGSMVDGLVADQCVDASDTRAALHWTPTGPDALDDLRAGARTI